MAPKKKSTNSAKSSSLPLIALIGVILGATAGVMISPYIKNKQNASSEKVVAQNTDAKPTDTKEQIIENTLTALGINAIPFSQGYLSQVKAETLVKHPNSMLLRTDTFWSDFLDSKKDSINKINDEYLSIGANFYAQFSKEELLKYYNLTKLPINTKILKIYSESLGDESFLNREIMGEIQDMVYKNLPAETEIESANYREN